MNLVLEPDQQQMRDFLLSKGKRKYLAVNMGKGKTAATLSGICRVIRNTAGGALVVAPLNVCLLAWPAEIELWDQFRWLKVANLRTKEGRIAWAMKSAHIYLINWDSLPKFCREVMLFVNKPEDMPVNMVIYDEMSKAKSHSSKRVNQWRRFTYLFEYHWALSGTPNPNSYADLFAQMRLLCGSKSPLGTAFGKFQQQYFDAKDWNQYKWDLKKGAKEDIEEAIRPYMLSLGGGEFPLEVIDEEVTLPPETMKFYRKLEKDLLAEINGKQIIALSAAVLVQKLVQATAGQIYDEHKEVVHTHKGKIEGLKAIRKRHKKEPLLVATMFKHERAQIKEAFPEAELFDKTPEQLDRWNAGKIPMLITDPRSAAHGVNMQKAAHIAVWTSLTYSRESWDQFNARLARKGQKKTVLIYRLMAQDTIDWAVASVLEHKGNQQAALLHSLRRLKEIHT